MKRERPLVASMVEQVKLPKMFRARQAFPRPKIPVEEIPARVRNILEVKKIAASIRPGMRIAITAGSRGIANAARITKCIVDFVKERGGAPFVVPAMGSHGGATAEGQREILAGYGIVEDYIGCPICSSMEVVEIGKNEEGSAVFIDKFAANADGIIINCRIKPHTAFRGPYESGIMKMMAIGLGKQYGAEACHEAGFKNMAKVSAVPWIFALLATVYLPRVSDQTEMRASLAAMITKIQTQDCMRWASQDLLQQECCW